MRVTLIRTVGFRATHRYWKPEWSAEQNRARFGRTGEEHPHEYTCAVTVSGPLDAETGMIVDLTVLDRILDEEVVQRLGGKYLNRDLAEFADGRAQPSCEALARLLFPRIAARLHPNETLERVRVAEDASLYAECTRQ